MQNGSQIAIRPAVREDRETLIDLFYKLLCFLDPFEHDMLPTQGNATTMVDTVFLPAAEQGEPILIAWDDVIPVGAIFWPIQHHAYKSRWVTAFGYGTYLDPTHRSRKVGTLLRDEAVRILKEKGVQKLIGVVLFKNEISVKASDRYGFKPYARLDLLDIASHVSGNKNIPQMSATRLSS